MHRDEEYSDTANAHRGEATEILTEDLLRRVFGAGRVYRNVDIYRGHKHIGEIDVLAVHGDRLVLCQAKAKKLTVAARQGDSRRLVDDFRAAIQKAYDQAFRCAAALLESSGRMVTSAGRQMELRWPIEEIYPICIVADQYPALALQCRQFLSVQERSRIVAPIVLDVFSLDVILEFLRHPAEFVNYLRLRARFRERTVANIEHVFLSYHLNGNLWIDRQFDMVMLEDGLDQEMSSAMYVRRLGVPGVETPAGILTRERGAFGQIIAHLQRYEDPAIVALVLCFLEAGSDVWKEMDLSLRGVRAAARRARCERTSFTYFADYGVGLTLKCGLGVESGVMESLQDACRAHKYQSQAAKWVGLRVNMDDGSLEDVFSLQAPWEKDRRMEDMLAKRSMEIGIVGVRKGLRVRKVGRNEPCPCGSGKKFKKCCIWRGRGGVHS